MKPLYILPFCLLIFLGCKSKTGIVSSDQATGSQQEWQAPGPPAMVYKTSENYNNLVPVTLSTDKTSIIAYPHPGDLMAGEAFATPTELDDGYLLDNRGITKNTAFLRLSYEEYANMDHLLPLDVLFDLIIDKEPFTELYDCGVKTDYPDIKAGLNDLIQANQLRAHCKLLVP